jgi:hypothetical protein
MTCRIVYALMCLVLASSPLAAAPPKSGTVKDWTFTDYADGTAGAQTTNESESSLGVYCASKDNCLAYLATDSGCQDGSKYTVMMNANSGANALLATCKSLATPRSKQQFALFFEDLGAVLDTMLKDHTVGFAIPLASGQFKVVRFSLEGSNETLAAVDSAEGAAPGAKPAVNRDETL